jgi:cytoskeletal protein CcmA (bactofilin family)
MPAARPFTLERHMSFWSKQEHATRGEAQGAVPPEMANPARQERNVAILPMKRDEIPSSLGGSSDLLLGAGSEFEGKLTLKGTVRIDAIVKGSIETDDVLIVGEHARIEANISCGTVIVHGQVNGNVRATTAIELKASARVRGDLDTPSLSAEKGAFLQGAVRMEGLERSAHRPATSAPPPAHSVGAAAPLAS